MSNKNNIIEDLSKLAGNAFGVAIEGKKALQEKISGVASSGVEKLHFASQDELEIVKKIALKALKENEELKKRLDILEGRKKVATKKPVAKKSPKKKATTKKAVKK